MNNQIAIVGIGETSPVHKSQKDIKTLVLEAVMMALSDAGIKPHEVDGIVTEAGIMPYTVPHDYLAEELGISRNFDASISYGGAGIVCAPSLAQMAINSGHANVVVSYFGVSFGTLEQGPYGFHNQYPAKRIFEKPYGFYGQPVYFALLAQRYMHEYGLRSDQLAELAITQREHAILNGKAQIKIPLTLEDYYNSRLIADPLRVPDCCLVSDGAGAIVMTSAKRAKDCAKSPVYVMGVGFAAPSFSCESVLTQNPEILKIPGATQASIQAIKKAGISINDIDFVEIYDCFTISCLMQLEDLGFCNKGEGGSFIQEGNVKLNGKLPMNTHGGFLSYSYRVGIEHVTEAVRQLRQEASSCQVEGAEIGLVSGLSVPEYGVLILRS